jgi:hypothetical protein
MLPPSKHATSSNAETVSKITDGRQVRIFFEFNNIGHFFTVNGGETHELLATYRVCFTGVETGCRGVETGCLNSS